MTNEITIAGQEIGPEKSPFLIAEIGMNHNGDLELAKEMIEAAADSGADAVKFQTYKTERYFPPDYSDFEQRKEYELKPSWHETLMDVANSNDVAFISTPFDRESVDLLDELGVPCFKIASFDVTNHHLVEYIAEKGKPIILSTGYSTHSEVAEAVERIRSVGNSELVLLHCISVYPTPVEQMNLNAMERLQSAFSVPVGLSDHTHGSTVAPVAATAMGASVIEKHFTTDNDLPGYDHAMSETPESFDTLTKEVRQAHKTLGDGHIEPREKEKESLPEARRTLYWKESYEPGTEITEDMILPLRPGGGMTVDEIQQLLGNELAVAVDEVTKIGSHQIQWDSEE